MYLGKLLNKSFPKLFTLASLQSISSFYKNKLMYSLIVLIIINHPFVKGVLTKRLVTFLDSLILSALALINKSQGHDNSRSYSLPNIHQMEFTTLLHYFFTVYAKIREEVVLWHTFSSLRMKNP